MNRITNWYTRLDRWQRQGGTPRWFIWMWAITIPRLLPAMILWGILVYIVIRVSTEPNRMFAIIGIFALMFWSMRTVDSVIPDPRDISNKTNLDEP